MIVVQHHRRNGFCAFHTCNFHLDRGSGPQKICDQQTAFVLFRIDSRNGISLPVKGGRFHLFGIFRKKLTEHLHGIEIFCQASELIPESPRPVNGSPVIESGIQRLILPAGKDRKIETGRINAVYAAGTFHRMTAQFRRGT